MDNSTSDKKSFILRTYQEIESEEQNPVNQTQNLLSSLTFPAILHYLQFQWQKMEHEKQKWLIEKAELQAQQTILEGRIMSQFNLKKDLIRRIKMLEHCLRAERAKYHKLKYGIEPPQLHVEDEELKNECSNENNSMPEITNTANWKKGRHLLRQYLLEIGYTDAIINIRSNRVRLLLGLNANENELNENNQNINNINAEAQDILNQQKEDKKYKNLVLQPNSTRLLATEAESSVASTIAFLKEQNNSQMNSADQDDNEDEIDNANDIIDSETEEVLSEFDFLSTHLSKLSTNTIASKSKNVDIGELADITPNDENSENVGSKSIESLILDEVGKMTKKTDKISINQQDWNPRFLLKSHFDVVRCVRFHHREALVITGSEDETIKLWNLNKASCNTNKNLEPIYTYRGHKSAVLSLLIVENQIYSGGLNGEILVWQIPETFNSIEPYETYDASLFLGNLEGHTDSVWSLVALHTNDNLKEEKKEDEVSEVVTEECQKVNFICSVSADGTIKVWDIEKRECSKTIVLNETWGKATCLAAFPCDAIVGADAKSNPGEKISQYLAVSFTKGSIIIFDVNSSNFSQPILIINENKQDYIKNRINSIIVHPKSPLIVSAHEDKCIRFWNYSTGECDFEMIAHLDEVTCLDFDSKGPHLISGGHDSSVRLWNFYHKKCIKETKSHIEKFSEGILDVSFHPTQNYFATAGADAKVQIFGLRVNNFVNNVKS